MIEDIARSEATLLRADPQIVVSFILATSEATRVLHSGMLINRVAASVRKVIE